MEGMNNRALARFSAAPRALLASAAIAAAIVIGAAQAAAAEPASGLWQIGEITGEVRSRVGDGPWQTLRPDDAIAPRSEIETGPGARVRLTGPEGDLAMLPNSRIVFAEPDGETAASARIIQRTGSVQLRVSTPAAAPLRIETPLLAAAVADASLTITVNAKNAALYVSGGAAEISSVLTGEQAVLRPRQMGWVNAPSGGWLRTFAVRPQATPPRTPPASPARAPSHGLKSVAGLPGGRTAG